MPRWILGCPECNQHFTHSTIPGKRTPQHDDLLAWLDFLSDKPIPIGGLTVECPNCKKTSLYQPHQLVYRAS